uniref:Putative secreted protein n=1 Tax=Anopheles darlingi TaxID=43151 RepID=A0A2M4D7W9_ANODA
MTSNRSGSSFSALVIIVLMRIFARCSPTAKVGLISFMCCISDPCWLSSIQDLMLYLCKLPLLAVTKIVVVSGS